MKNPLPKSMYGTPLAEFYRPWRFYSKYFPNSVEPAQKTQPKLADAAAAFFQVVVGSAAAIVAGTIDKDYPGVTNRAAVKTHLWRERNAALALRAKVRDGFTCQICRGQLP